MRFALLIYPDRLDRFFRPSDIADLGTIRPFTGHKEKFYIHLSGPIQGNSNRIELRIRRLDNCVIEDYWLDDVRGSETDLVTDLLEERFWAVTEPIEVGAIVVDWRKHSEQDGWIEILTGMASDQVWDRQLSSPEICLVTEMVWKTFPLEVRQIGVRIESPVLHYSMQRLGSLKQ